MCVDVVDEVWVFACILIGWGYAVDLRPDVFGVFVSLGGANSPGLTGKVTSMYPVGYQCYQTPVLPWTNPQFHSLSRYVSSCFCLVAVLNSCLF